MAAISLITRVLSLPDRRSSPRGDLLSPKKVRAPLTSPSRLSALVRDPAARGFLGPREADRRERVCWAMGARHAVAQHPERQTAMWIIDGASDRRGPLYPHPRADIRQRTPPLPLSADCVEKLADRALWKQNLQ